MTVAGYTLGRLLGRGGMSEVYAASHPVHGDALALKLLQVELGDAAQTRRIHHPNVIRIHDAGRDAATGQCYVAMDRIDGEDLATRLRVRPLTEAEARSMFAAIADGMHAVHAAGIVHRDLKPANVMLRGAVPLIVDFGIAKSLGAQSALATARRIGTPAYMAPEQLTGGLIAPCVDVWALGVMMFEAVTGTLPFDDFAEGRAPQLFEAAPRALSRVAVSPGLDHLIARCLERDPGKRARSMEAIARELRGEVDVEAERVTQDAGALLPAPPAPVATSAPVPMASRARRWPYAAAAIAVVGIVVTAFAMRGGAASAKGADPMVGLPDRTPDARMGSDPFTGGSSDTAPSAGRTPDEEKGSDPISGGSGSIAAVSANAIAGASASHVPAGTRAASKAFSVDVRSRPAGAQIFVAGRAVGVTPKRLELSGPTSVVVRRTGYRTANVRAERPGALDIKLRPTKPRESLD